MKKQHTEFNVGDIIKYKTEKSDLDKHYYLVVKIGRINYTVFCFDDGNYYPVAKCDWSFYERKT